MKVDVIIPALDEEAAVGNVVRAIPSDRAREIVVVDNGSRDRTSEVVREAGGTALWEPQRGYGSACLKGIAYLKEKPDPPDVVVFLDADFSDFPEQMDRLLDPIEGEHYDFVIGSRALGERTKGALLPQQVFGNRLATWMIRKRYGVHYTDLGPFRAIRFEKLLELGMEDPDYGWTVEMQLKAAKHGLKTKEVPVDLRKRIGRSKVAGTLKGTIGAGYKIIKTILSYR